ncbi:MAG: DNA polymerase III subunit gamma/tau [Bacillales bacterium]
MSYQALYNKYRSKTFNEVVGQETIIKILQNSIESNKISHAYLFSGPRGTGKTSVARLFAKALNCEKGLGCQCNKCNSCLEVNRNNHPDIIEIDAASNSGVEEVRNLINNVGYSPMMGRYKVYIIDEVHMMTNNAFNALLKTLEEPPKDIVFILCTTEPYKLLPTILSRCQRFEFKKIDNLSLKNLINNVLDKEKVTIDEEALDLIVELSNGGARDALSILEQTISYTDKNISLKDIEELFGIVNNKDKANIFKFILEKNLKSLLEYYQILINRNVDINRLVNDMLLCLKEYLVNKITNSKNTKDKNLYTILNKFNTNEIILMIETLLKCNKDLKTYNNSNYLFELYLIKIVNLFKNKEYIKETNNNNNNIDNKTEINTAGDVANFIEEKTSKEDISENYLDITSLDELAALSPISEKKETVNKSIFYVPQKAKPKVDPNIPTGDRYYIDDENIIKITFTGSKDLKIKTSERWKYLPLFKNDEDLAIFAKLLEASEPFIVTDKFLLLSFDYTEQAKRCNVKLNQEKISLIIEKLTGLKLFVYGIDRIETNKTMTTYINLKQVKKSFSKEELDNIEIGE